MEKEIFMKQLYILIPSVYGLDKSAAETIRSGDRVRVDADEGTVETL